MLTFWIVAALLIVAALAFVLVPLLRPRARSGPTVREANLAVLRGQRQDIETDVALGLLPRDARESALAELSARAEEDLAAPGESLQGPPSRPWVLAAFFAVLVPAVTVGFYLWVGTPAATDPKAMTATAADAQPGQHQIEEMVVALEQKMRDRPDDVQGWMLLARSFAATGKTEKALAAYAHLAQIAPQDASVLADYADALGLSQGRSLAGQPTELAMRALQLDPRHPKALALAATAKLNGGDFAASLGYWERLYAVLPPGSEDATEVRNIIEDVRSRAAAAGKPQPPSKILAAAPAPAAPVNPAMSAAPVPPMGAAPAKAAAGGKSVSGTVKLADSLAGKAAPADTLFIYARAESGSRMPLAIIRGGAGELPKAFVLDDSMGMSPAVKLSTTPSVVIEARVSKSGGAVTQPGDLIGVSKPVAPGAKDVAIVIDRLVP
ncbi:MAG TPA: c-type cytochrome biogenesis protein CcmI [Usitatibacteraceae bacterium]|nr:c-type cytochrome biogenesis protein CcmI [Usitatibacteraceae bacterium]